MTYRKIATVNRPRVEVVVAYDASVREYRCRIVADKAQQPDADYFTNDKDDALATAKLMANNIAQNLVWEAACEIPLDELAELRRIVTQVWQQIGYDVMQAVAECGDEELTNEAAIESCLDADRPLMLGETERVLTKLAYQKYGFDAVCLALTKNLNLV